MKIKKNIILINFYLAIIIFGVSIPFSFSFNNPYSDLKFSFLCLGIFLLSLFYIKRKKTFKLSKSLIVFGLYILSGLLSLIFFRNYNAIFQKSIIYFNIWMFFVFYQNSTYIRRKTYIYIKILYFISLLYLILQGLNIDINLMNYKYISFYGNPDYTAIFFLPFIVYLINNKEKDLRRKIFDISLYLIPFIILIQMKLAIFSLVIIMCIYFYKKKRNLIFLFFISVVILGIIFGIGEIIKENNSLLSRIYLYKGAIKGFINNPIFGYGENSFKNFFPIFKDKELFSITGIDSFSETSHNFIFDIMFERGFIGIYLFLTLIYICLKNNKTVLEISSIIICGLFINPLFYISTSFIFFYWLFLGNKNTKFLLSVNKYILLIISGLSFIYSSIFLIESFQVKNFYLFRDNPQIYTDSGFFSFNIGNFYRSKRNFNKAKEFYERSILKNENYWPSLYNYAITLYSLKEYNEAEIFIDKALELNSVNFNIYFTKGLILYSNKKYIQSFKPFEKAYYLSGKKDKQAYEFLLNIIKRYPDKFDNYK